MAVDWSVLDAFVDAPLGDNSTGTRLTKAVLQAAFRDPIDAAMLLKADFATGTWTPVIGGVGGTSGQAYSVQSGSYVKLGPLVAAHFHATLSTLGTVTSTVQIQGLPFANSSVGGAATAAFTTFAWHGFTTAIVALMGEMGSGTSAVSLYKATAATTGLFTATLVTADLANTSQIRGVIVYRASS